MPSVLGYVSGLGAVARSGLNEVYQSSAVQSVAQAISDFVNKNYEMLFIITTMAQLLAAPGNFIVAGIVGACYYNSIVPINFNIDVPSLFETPIKKCATLIAIIAMRSALDLPALAAGFLFGCYLYRHFTQIEPRPAPDVVIETMP